jgi:threonine synthase
MRYLSTRGQAAPRDFEGVLLAGLAEDGGLFLPESWPTLSPAEWRGQPLAAVLPAPLGKSLALYRPAP